MKAEDIAAANIEYGRGKMRRWHLSKFEILSLMITVLILAGCSEGNDAGSPTKAAPYPADLPTPSIGEPIIVYREPIEAGESTPIYITVDSSSALPIAYAWSARRGEIIGDSTAGDIVYRASIEAGEDTVAVVVTIGDLRYQRSKTFVVAGRTPSTVVLEAPSPPQQTPTGTSEIDLTASAERQASLIQTAVAGTITALASSTSTETPSPTSSPASSPGPTATEDRTPISTPLPSGTYFSATESITLEKFSAMVVFGEVEHTAAWQSEPRQQWVQVRNCENPTERSHVISEIVPVHKLVRSNIQLPDDAELGVSATIVHAVVATELAQDYETKISEELARSRSFSLPVPPHSSVEYQIMWKPRTWAGFLPFEFSPGDGTKVTGQIEYEYEAVEFGEVAGYRDRTALDCTGTPLPPVLIPTTTPTPTFRDTSLTATIGPTQTVVSSAPVSVPPLPATPSTSSVSKPSASIEELFTAVSSAPELIEPKNDYVTTDKKVQFVWSWSGKLTDNMGFEIRGKYRSDGAFEGLHNAAETHGIMPDAEGNYRLSIGIPDKFEDRRFLWTVAVVQLEPYKVLGTEAPPRFIEVRTEKGTIPPGS